mmetsp:Transcript_8654/g.15973  ORF Transcript_8654/g.15973 Transcript_8654/m.15973 type:complete len:249 (+) Transcript_8654:562-1308(+)
MYHTVIRVSWLPERSRFCSLLSFRSRRPPASRKPRLGDRVPEGDAGLASRTSVSHWLILRSLRLTHLLRYGKILEVQGVPLRSSCSSESADPLRNVLSDRSDAWQLRRSAVRMREPPKHSKSFCSWKVGGRRSIVFGRDGDLRMSMLMLLLLLLSRIVGLSWFAIGFWFRLLMRKLGCSSAFCSGRRWPSQEMQPEAPSVLPSDARRYIRLLTRRIRQISRRYRKLAMCSPMHLGRCVMVILFLFEAT